MSQHHTMTPVPPPAPGYVVAGGRPGILNAVGVASIVVAAVSLLGGLIGGFQTFFAYRTAQVTATQARSVMSRASATGDAALTPDKAAALAEGARKAAARRRTGVVDVLVNLEPTVAPARRQLDAALARHGAAILPRGLLLSDRVATEDVEDVVKRHGVVSSGPDDPAPQVFYVFDTGRLEVYPSSAVFRPKSGPVLRSDAKDPPPATDAFDVSPPDGEDDGGAAPATPGLPPPPTAGGQLGGGQTGSAATAPARGSGRAYVPLPPTASYASGLTGQQINGVVSKVASAVKPKGLTPGQRTALQSALQEGGTVLVPPEAAYSPVRMADVQPDGTLMVRFPGGFLVVDGNGTITDRFSEAVERIMFHPLALTLLVGEAATSGLLAALLIVAGSMALRKSRLGGGLHWIYAIAKIPVVIVGAVAFYWVMNDLNRGVAGLGGGGVGDGWRNFWLTVTIMGGVYPVILLIVLNTPAVRHYYATQA